METFLKILEQPSLKYPDRRLITYDNSRPFTQHYAPRNDLYERISNESFTHFHSPNPAEHTHTIFQR